MYFWPWVISVSYLDGNTLLLCVYVCVCVCVWGGTLLYCFPQQILIMKCSKKGKNLYTLFIAIFCCHGDQP